MKKLILLAVLMTPGISLCQVVTAANSVSFQPLITRDAEGFSRCGVRIVVASMEESQKSIAYDFSITMADDTFSLMKAGAYNVPFDRRSGWDITKMKPRLPAPDSFWIAKRDDAATLKPTKYMKSEDPGFSMGGADGSMAAKILWAIAKQEPMQISLHYNGSKYDDVVAFQASLSTDDRAAFDACFAGMYKRMLSKMPKQK